MKVVAMQTMQFTFIDSPHMPHVRLGHSKHAIPLHIHSTERRTDSGIKFFLVFAMAHLIRNQRLYLRLCIFAAYGQAAERRSENQEWDWLEMGNKFSKLMFHARHSKAHHTTNIMRRKIYQKEEKKEKKLEWTRCQNAYDKSFYCWCVRGVHAMPANGVFIYFSSIFIWTERINIRNKYLTTINRQTNGATHFSAPLASCRFACIAFICLWKINEIGQHLQMKKPGRKPNYCLLCNPSWFCAPSAVPWIATHCNWWCDSIGEQRSKLVHYTRHAFPFITR